MSNSIGHFSLWGDFEVDEITATLGMQPSAVHRKGDILEGTDVPAAVATWDLHCPAELLIQEQIEYLLALLFIKEDALQKLAHQFRADLNLASARESGVEVLSIKPETFQTLARLNITVNCFFGEGEVEDAN